MSKNNKAKIARNITNLIRNKPIDFKIEEEVLTKGRIFGITGAMGVGKSSFINNVSKFLSKEKKIGILSLDPTSPISGGSLLGDRIRMKDLSLNENVFIRSIPAKNYTNSIPDSIGKVIFYLIAEGYEIIFLETIGTGQADYAIINYIDELIYILSADVSDSIQIMKSGIIEIADIIAVNKIDLTYNEFIKQDIEGRNKKAKVFCISNKTGENIEKISNHILEKSKINNEGRRLTLST